MAIGHEATGATAPPVRGGPDTIRHGPKACRRNDSGGHGRSPDTLSARRQNGQTETGDDDEPVAYREGGPSGRRRCLTARSAPGEPGERQLERGHARPRV